MVGEKAGKYIRAILRRAYFRIYLENKGFLHNYSITTSKKKFSNKIP